MKCGNCGIKGKVTKKWRVRGPWARCPTCVIEWMKEQRELELREKEPTNACTFQRNI